MTRIFNDSVQRSKRNKLSQYFAFCQQNRNYLRILRPTRFPDLERDFLLFRFRDLLWSKENIWNLSGSIDSDVRLGKLPQRDIFEIRRGEIRNVKMGTEIGKRDSPKNWRAQGNRTGRWTMIACNYPLFRAENAYLKQEKEDSWLNCREQKGRGFSLRFVPFF